MTPGTGARRALFAAALAVAGAAYSQSVSAQPTTQPTDLGDTEDQSSSLPWRGTSLTWAQSLNVNAFSQSAQLSYNPTYSWAFILEPRWYLGKKTYINIDQRVYLELTDSDTTLYARRTMLSDTVAGVDTELYATSFPKLGDLAVTGGAHLTFPTSIASRAATMIVAPRLRAGASMNFKHVLHGLGVGLQGRYTHRFMTHNTVEAAQPFPCLPSTHVDATECTQLDTMTNTQDALSLIVSGSLAISELFSVEALAWLSWSHGAALAPGHFTSDSGQVHDYPDASLTHWRNERYLVLGADWNATDWLMVGLSVIDYFPEKAPDGTNRGIGNPLDLAVGLSTTIAFDHLYLRAVGKKPRAESARLWIRR